MKFSILKEKITPEFPVFQQGFSGRARKKSIGVNDDIYATVALIQSNKTVAIIAMDLLYGNRRVADEIKKAINEKYGLVQDEIIINYAHTHSVISIKGEDDDNPENVIYYNTVKTKIMEAVDKAFDNLTEGDAYICKGKSKFGVSRRYPSEQGALWKPYFNENAIDKDLFLIKLVDKSNEIRGLIYNYACHPTTLGPDNYWISADYPGMVRKYLEEKYEGMIPMFLQGCGADIKPYITADNGRFRSCTLDEVDQAGKSLAGEIQELIDNAGWKKINVELQTESSEVKLYSEIWSIEKWETIANNPDEPEYRKIAAKKVIDEMKNGKIKSYIPYYISLLRLDDKTCIIGLENEVVSEIGKKIKKILSDEDAIVLGYSNSIMCYIPTKDVLLNGGYESASFISARLAGQFINETEDIIIGRAVVMAKHN
ncbi:MAG TPA: neutral/alkaline non-lysosomal ceramidase N-terminal domain-containing protein [Clostridiales bacterium]|nr:neutral/alkaline non-lysosomal ceramidase N-terminal domain-containing protein [Clostridiales bacterium]